METLQDDPGGFDVVLLDVDMVRSMWVGREFLENVCSQLTVHACVQPRLSGLEAAQALRHWDNPQTAATPIIFCSASVLREDIRKCEEAGMDAFVAKPIDKAMLLAELDRVVKERS